MSQDHELEYAPMATVERYHTEEKAWRDRHSDVHRELDKGVGYLLTKDKALDERLGAGASTMAKLENQIEKVNAKISWPVSKIVAAIAAVVVPAFMYVTTLVWYASKYPTREEFKDVQTQLEILNRTVDRLTWKLGEKSLPAPMVAPLLPAP